MICFALILNLHCSSATGIYMLTESAKLQNLMIEPVCFFWVLQSIKALPVTTQSFVIFIYKIKHIEAERYNLMPKNRSCFDAKM